MRWSLAALLLVLACLAYFAFDRHRPRAPEPASLTGRVHDANDCPIVGARVRLQATPHKTRTDAQGRFTFENLSHRGRITAWKPGYFIGGEPRSASPLTISLTPLPSQDHEDYVWIDPTPSPKDKRNCGNCHGTIYNEWAASGHARSARGRHFQNLYTGEDWHGNANVSWGLLTQYELGAGVCTSCHVPGLAEGDPAQLDLSTLADPVASQGVHCDFCHKIAEVGKGTLGLSHGKYNLEFLRPSPTKPDEQVFFGPLDDVERGEDAYSPLYGRSRYCASCHEGVVFGVHVYSTYSEWLASPAARRGVQCQDCHMRPTGSMHEIAEGPPQSLPASTRNQIHVERGVPRDSGTLSNHRFFAGSHTEMIKGCLRVDVEFAEGQERTQVTVRIHVEGVGHAVPTGYIDRHLLLVLTGEDTEGQPIEALFGPRLPTSAGSEWKDRAGSLFARVLQDESGQSPAPFWQADAKLRDTRLMPGTPTIQSWSYAKRIAKVRVQIRYRRFWQAVIDAKHWPNRDTIVFERIYEPLP